MRPRATLAGSIKSANKVFALWGPSNIGATLSVWLDAADSSTITLNGSTVSQWSDKSGNGLHFLQATAANQPTYTASNPLSNNLGSIGGTTNAGTIGLICNGAFLTAQIFCVLMYKDGTVNFPAGEYPTAIIEWNIGISEFADCFTGTCALTGWEISMSYDQVTASFDRIDSQKPYDIGNIQWVHVMVNMCKNKYCQNQFIDMCKAIVNKKAMT